MFEYICVQSRHVACVGSLQVALNSSAATTAAPEDDEAAESCNRTCQQLIGIAFVLVGEVAVCIQLGFSELGDIAVLPRLPVCVRREVCH